MNWSELSDDQLVEHLKDLNPEALAIELETMLSSGLDFKEMNNTLIDVQKKLYWKLQRLDLIIQLTHRCVEFLESHQETTAATISPYLYNLASFTAPWWSDSLQVSEEQGKEGWNASKKLVELRTANNFDTIKIAGAHWILAVHEAYTTKDTQRAIEEFNRTEEMARSVPQEKMSALLVGNSIEGVGRAKLLSGDASGRADVKRAQELYRESEDEYRLGESDIFLKSINHA